MFSNAFDRNESFNYYKIYNNNNIFKAMVCDSAIEQINEYIKDEEKAIEFLTLLKNCLFQCGFLVKYDCEEFYIEEIDRANYEYEMNNIKEVCIDNYF